MSDPTPGRIAELRRIAEAATPVLLTSENLEEAIMVEIADKAMTQRDVAQTYAIMIRQCGPDGANWARINRAIMDRWGMSGLERIKRLAWSGKAFLRCAGGEE